MPQQDTVIRLLLVEDRVDEAEQFISVLRNGGMAIRPLRPESTEELARQILEQPVDMVLAAHAGRAIPFGVVMQVVEASGKDIPVIASIQTLSEDVLFDALNTGARGIALRERPEHLQRVVRSEFAALERRRSLRLLEAALRETERRCDALIASSRDPIAYVHEGMHIRANEAYLEMFGYDDFEDIEGLPLLDMIAPSHAGSFKQLLKQPGKGEAPPRTLQVVAQRADGSSFDAVMEFAQASYEGEACLQIVFRQQALDADMVRELDALRQRDQATGLYNRSHFLALLEDAVAAAAQGRSDQALLLIEPDHYAALIGDIGMAHADELLARLAARLQLALGEHDQAARFSDHGFAVLSTRCDHRQSTELAERLRAIFAGHIAEAGERSLNLTVSIGGVQIGEKIALVPQVLAKASLGLQAAIGVGGNRVEIYDPAATDRAEEERVHAWVERIREALENDRFLLHYQPIVSLQGETGETYEVFLRMQVGNGDLVPPLSFLSIAEEHGLLEQIDRWVIARAIEVLAERAAQGRQTTLFVKVTQASLTEGRLAAWIGERLKASGVPGERLVLEIPESKAFTALRATQDFQKAVAAYGCRIVLEQFGAGLNSFQLLNHLDPAFLKIDRSFMEDLPKNVDTQNRLREITDRARDAGKQTIAEFVQDAASMSVLFSTGVDYVEGHFLAPAAAEMNYDFA